MKKKIGAWAAELASHDIYREPELSQEFERETGAPAGWPTHSVGKTASTLGQFKGVTSELEGPDHARCSYAYEVAAWLERTYAGTSEYGKYNGRGFAFRASVEALRKAGV